MMKVTNFFLSIHLSVCLSVYPLPFLSVPLAVPLILFYPPPRVSVVPLWFLPVKRRGLSIIIKKKIKRNPLLPGLGLGRTGAFVLVGALGTTLGGALVATPGLKKSSRLRSAEDDNNITTKCSKSCVHKCFLVKKDERFTHIIRNGEKVMIYISCVFFYFFYLLQDLPLGLLVSLEQQSLAWG